MNESLTVGDLAFAIRRSDRRRTIGITVDRAGELIVDAPTDCPLTTLETIVRRKSHWIYTKLAEKELLVQPSTPKQFVSGEGFYFLGRSYRLLLTTPDDKQVAALQLMRGRFILRRDEQCNAERHFVNWYIEHGKPWLSNRILLFATRIGVTPMSMTIRELGFRWGSCSPRGQVNFHYRVMQLPPRIIDYLVVHELVHLLEPKHNEEFWKRIRFVIPDFFARRRWLADNGAHF